MRSFLSGVENYAVNFFSKELEIRRKEEKKALEDRDRFLQEQREKLHAKTPTPVQHLNGEQNRRQKRSRRLADKEETVKKPSLRSKLRKNTAIENESSDDDEDYSPQPLAQFVRIIIFVRLHRSCLASIVFQRYFRLITNSNKTST